MASYLSERTVAVGLLAPIDKTGGTVATQGVSMQAHNRCTFYVYMGVMSSTDTVTLVVKGNTAYANGGAPIACKYRVATSGAAGVSYVDGTLNTLSTSGLTIADGQDFKLYIIEVLASDLTAISTTYDYVNINISSPGAHACLMSIVAVLNDERYPQLVPAIDPTA